MFGKKRGQAGDRTEQAEEWRGSHNAVDEEETALKADQFGPSVGLEHLSSSPLFPAQDQAASGRIGSLRVQFLGPPLADELQNGFRGDLTRQQGQGTFKEEENHQDGANSKWPDEDASAFQKGIHRDTLNPAL